MALISAPKDWFDGKHIVLVEEDGSSYAVGPFETEESARVIASQWDARVIAIRPFRTEDLPEERQ